MNKKLDTHLSTSKPNITVPDNFTDEVMSKLSAQPPKRSSWQNMFFGIKPAFIVSAFVLLLGIVLFTTANRQDGVQTSNGDEQRVAEVEGESTVADPEELIAQDAVDPNNPEGGSEEGSNQETEPQSVATIQHTPTTVAQAEAEVETIVEDITEEVASFNEDIDFHDDLLSDTSLDIAL